ncbi:MAG: hypothetical protein ABII88_02765 [Candidatus Omnitrophota bacterium]
MNIFKTNTLKNICYISCLLTIIAAALLCPAAAVCFAKNVEIPNTLSPKVQIKDDGLAEAFNEFVSSQSLLGKVSLPAKCIPMKSVREYGVKINNVSTNFKIGKYNFRVPPYIADRVYRVHITDIDADKLTFQKMGIGVGQRRPTKAVVLADSKHPKNQLLIFDDGQTIKITRLGAPGFVETVNFGAQAQFNEMSRQDSFLERTTLGSAFLDEVFGLSQESKPRAGDIVKALTELAKSNPKLKKPLPITLAFFSQDYILTFSRELIKYSSVSVLRDREQRGRFIAIVDELNPENFVVFERRGEKVVLLGNNEQAIIGQLVKKETSENFYFSDYTESAKFCRTVSRELVTYSPTKSASSFSVRKGLQLHVGVDNQDIGILKVHQVTQATTSGQQIKHRPPTETESLIWESYPLYILDEDFPQVLPMETTPIRWGNPEFLTFPVETQKEWPDFLNHSISGENRYYQKIEGIYLRKGKKYTVYKFIRRQDVITKIIFNQDGTFNISGITWNNGIPVAFRNISQISLPSLITQLNSSRYIDIDPQLAARFELGALIGTPIRAVYSFKDGVFEQSGTLHLDSLDDFAGWQRTEDATIAQSRWLTEQDMPSSLELFGQRIRMTIPRNLVEQAI